MASKIDLDLAEQFLALWFAKVPPPRAHHWHSFTTVLHLWRNQRELWDNPPEQFPLIEHIATQFGCTPREAYIAAEQLRQLGFNLPQKEDEPRFAPKERKRFEWVKFAEMLFQTKSPQTVANAFDLSPDTCDEKIAMLIAGGIELPEMVQSTIPDWMIRHADMILNPAKFTPEEKRTIGAKYRVMRPKHKKTYYYNGTGCYRPRPGDKYRPCKISASEWQQIARIRQLFAPQAKASPSFDHYRRNK